MRPEPAVQYKRLVKRVMVDAFRQVFTDFYPDSQFRNLKITTEYPMKKADYPCLIIGFSEGQLLNAGVGHEEFLVDDDGQTRKHYMYRFEGEVEIAIIALSPVDLDVLSDSVVEMIAFGRLSPLANAFYDRIYSNPTNTGQLMFNSDVIMPIPENTIAAPWLSDNTLLYQGGYRVETHGAFRSTTPSELIGYIDQVIVNMYVGTDGSVATSDGQLWLPQNNVEDIGFLKSEASISATTS